MGLEIQHVLSDESHYCHYECVICQSIVDLDCLVTTVCGHCFCRTCLLQWLHRTVDQSQGLSSSSESSRKACPTCHEDLLYANIQNNNKHFARYLPTMMIGSDTVLIQPLEKCQPLAHRVLRRIRVRCPLQGVQCEWKGDYSDLNEHLLSQTAHQRPKTTTPSQHHAQKRSNHITVNHVDSTESAPQSTIKEQLEKDREFHRPDKQRVVVSDGVSPSHNLRQIAESYKEQGNAKFGSQHYDQARGLYTQALHVLAVRPATGDGDDPNLDLLESTLYSNRAACHYAEKAYNDSIADAEKALQKDPSYTKAAIRLARSFVQMGHFQKATESLMEAAPNCSDSSPLVQEMIKTKELERTFKQCQIFLDRKEYANAKLAANTLFRTTRAEAVLLAAAEADLGLGLTDSAARFSLTVLKENPQSLHGYFIRGQVSILDNDLVTGTNLLKQGIRMDPDDGKVRVIAKCWIQLSNRIKQSRDDFFRRQFESCVEILDQVIPTCPLLPHKSPLFASLHAERAKAWLRRKNYDAALKDSALVLYHQDDHLESWLIRFSSLHGLQKHQDVLDETKELMAKWGQGNEQIRQALQKADFEVRKAKRPDYYGLLGVSSLASEKEIKKAYRQKALQYHPDRYSCSEHNDAQRKEASEKFQQLGDALEILTHDFSKQLYDEGYDTEAIKARSEAAQRAARRSNHHH